MPIQLNRAAAVTRFQDALDLAQSDAELPEEWLVRAQKIGGSPSRTFIPMLGTALLARATDDRVDPFALRAGEHADGYSARNLCKVVLVPEAVRAHVSLGTTGNEPLNNRPFISAERVGPNLSVLAQARPYLDYLCESLASLGQLDSQEALHALAAFLRVRIDLGEARGAALEQVEHVLGVQHLAEASERFIQANPEGGRRGQALVAAALDLVFPYVRTSRVNDPSRHWAGDVVVFDAANSDRVIFAVEVKQRPATATEIIQLIDRAAGFGTRRVAVATLDPSQPDLPSDELRAGAWLTHGVHLTIFGNARELVTAALTWSRQPLDEALPRFPALVASRLEELEVSALGREDWLSQFMEFTT